MKRILSCALIAFTLQAQQAIALDQAFCALRDPDVEILSLFPRGDSYRSIVRDVSKKEVSSQIASELGTPLHFSELGKHTVYVVFDGETPIGLVHARPELGKWGIVEVAWALDLDLTIKNFAFMRCRDRSRKSFQGESTARKMFIQATMDSLRQNMVEGTFTFDKSKVPIPEDAVNLADALLLNALKTIVMRRVVWGDEITKLKSNIHAYR